MWPVISPPTVKSTSLFTPCSSQVYACAGSALSQILAPPGLGRYKHVVISNSLFPGTSFLGEVLGTKLYFKIRDITQQDGW